MHCKYCGELNDHKGTYCIKCGKKIKDLTSIEVKGVDEVKSSFCKKCGDKVTNRYCTNCGTFAYVLELKEASKFKTSEFNINKDAFENIKSKVSKVPVEDMKKNIKDKVTFENVKEYVSTNAGLKQASFSALQMIGVGLLLSFVLFSIIKNLEPVQYLFDNLDRSASYIDPQIAKLKPNFIDFFNLSMLSPANFSLNFREDSINIGANVTMQFKLIMFMFIPILAVFIGQLKQFKNDKSTSDNIAFYSLSALIFSIVLKIISMITTSNIRINDDYGGGSLKISMGFGNIVSIFSMFLFVLAIQMIISGLIKRDNPFAFLKITKIGNLNVKIGDLSNSLFTYVKSMSVFSFIITISLIIALISIKDEMGGKTSSILISSFFFIPTLFSQSWLFSSGFGIQTKVMDQFPVDLNIWKSFAWLKESGSYMADANLIWAYLVIIGALLGIVYVVYKSVKDIEKDSDFFIKIGSLAGFIIILNILLSYLVNIGVKIKNISTGSNYELADMLYDLDLRMLIPFIGSGTMSQGYLIATIIVTTLIWIFAIGALVYFLNDKEIFKTINLFIDEKSKIIISAYSLLMIISFTMAIKEFIYILPGIIESFIPMSGLFF